MQIANCKLQIANCKMENGKWKMEILSYWSPVTNCFSRRKPWMWLMTPQELSDRLLELAVRAGKAADALPNSRMGRHAAGQLVRCGTSPGANYEEACSAESRNDFVHKLRICLKELRETRFWLRLIVKAELLPEIRMSELIDEAGQLCDIMGKSVATASDDRSKSG
ncbi:MAG: four helix bundle protein [Pirellulales bacterium]